MNNPEVFMDLLKGYQAEIDSGKNLAKNFDQIRSTLADENFTPEKIYAVARAAGGVCVWVKNITLYYDVVVSVEPKKAAVAEMKVKLAEANEKKDKMEALVKDL